MFCVFLSVVYLTVNRVHCSQCSTRPVLIIPTRYDDGLQVGRIVHPTTEARTWNVRVYRRLRVSLSPLCLFFSGSPFSISDRLNILFVFERTFRVGFLKVNKKGSVLTLCTGEGDLHQVLSSRPLPPQSSMGCRGRCKQEHIVSV